MPNFFRPRSTARDQAADNERAQRIYKLLKDIMQECDAEERGLLKRYKATQQEASSVLGWLESEHADLKDARLDMHEQALIYCERRIAKIRQERQALQQCRDTFERARSPV